MVFLANFGNLKAMEFRTAANGGNCVGCNWLVAEGEIKQDTHIKFNEFVKENGGVPFTVILNSNGGNLYSAIQLGIRFRELGLITRIARSIPATWCKRDSDEICPDYYEEMRKGKCLSACAYAFLGGRERDVASKNKVTGHPDSIIGFHQFYNDKPKNEKIKKILEEDTYFSSEQLISAILLKYITDMGVDANVLGLSAIAGSNEMYYPNSMERKKLNIDYNPDFSFQEIDLQPYKGGLIGYSTPYYETPFNMLDQITFFCKKTRELEVLFTSKVAKQNLKKGKDLRLPGYFTLHLKFNNTHNYNYQKNIEIKSDRLKEWNDNINHYMTLKLNNPEIKAFIESQGVEIHIEVARYLGNYKANIPLNSNIKATLLLIMKNCF